MEKTLHQNRGKHKGFTLIELAITLVLMSFVVMLAGSLIQLASSGFVGSEVQMTLIREDSAFAAKLNEAIQESTVGFTVPKNSFNNINKLTAGWNYLGLMDSVHIPAAASRTGREIDSAQALVYIEYWGETAPSSVPADCNVIHNPEGYFIQKILGHAFKDGNGVDHSYSLVFNPTNPNNTAAQTIVYKFSANVEKNGTPLGEDGTTLDIDSMLSCLNAIQVVYKGSSTNPAVALAFRSDFMPTWAAQQSSTVKPAATVVMILDTSGSMGSSFGNTTRKKALQENACSLVESLSQNENINVILIPFSEWSCCYNTGQYFFNLGTQKQACINRINRLYFEYGTNLGDGMRFAYWELKRAYNRGENVGSVILMMMTDGEMNAYSKGSYNGFCIGEGVNSGTNTARDTAKAREYATLWGQRWTSDFTLSNTYLLSLSNGMSAADKQVLEAIFGTEAIEINNLTDFQTVFEDIGTSINEVIWAFEGPNL